MPSFKCKPRFLALLMSVGAAQAAYNDMDCLNGTFSAEVKHKALWGMAENVLSISKNQCVLTVKQERFKFFKKQWVLDVCREPVHIKFGEGSIDILKRETGCAYEASTSGFCKSMGELFGIFQDDGLIFAEGEKEDLGSDHGKVYCSFLLAKKYLEDGIVLGRNNHYDNFIIRGMGTRSGEKPTWSQTEGPAPEMVPTPASSPSGAATSGASDF